MRARNRCRTLWRRRGMWRHPLLRAQVAAPGTPGALLSFAPLAEKSGTEHGLLFGRLPLLFEQREELLPLVLIARANANLAQRVVRLIEIRLDVDGFHQMRLCLFPALHLRVKPADLIVG